MPSVSSNSRPPLSHVAPWYRPTLRSFARHFGVVVLPGTRFIGKLLGAWCKPTPETCEWAMWADDRQLFDHSMWLRLKVSGDLVVLVQPYVPVRAFLPPDGLLDLVCWPCGDSPYDPSAHAYIVGRPGAVRRLQKLGPWRRSDA